MTKRQLRLGAFMRPVSIHTGAWRYPGAFPDANFNFAHYKRFIQTLERGRFDAFFMADHLALLNMPVEALKRSHTVSSFDPLTLLPALAAVTEHIGLIATASTTYNEPYHIARKFASLDHISGGRAGWNLVTTSNPDAALNFGHDEHMAHGERYQRAREFFDVVTGLWDGWADDALVRDVETGLYFDPDRVHVLNHKGPEFSVRGPLNIARPVQGWPVIVQAGASEAGRQIAAETAEAIFASHNSLADGQAFYADVKGRMARLGRDPEHLKILPAAFVVVGDTAEEARAKRALLDSLVHYDSAIASLSIALGHDASKFDPDGPLPDVPETNQSKSGRERAIALARREGLTVRQLAQRLGGYGGLAMVGTPAMIADEMEEWLVTGGSDGFNVMFPYLPGGLDDFVDRVVPELQRRGIFRREYEGRTLRENLGLPRPASRFFPIPPAG
jgi:alkanesulfonate monooxygenase